MNATLLEHPGQTARPSRREGELSALVEKLLGEMAQLRREVAELRQQAGSCDMVNLLLSNGANVKHADEVDKLYESFGYVCFIML